MSLANKMLGFYLHVYMGNHLKMCSFQDLRKSHFVESHNLQVGRVA